MSRRYRCDCQATKHDLINNCLGCGRIVCAKEGSGPCVFCETLVCTNEEEATLARESRKSEKLLQKLLDSKVETDPKDASLQKALQAKNRLLEYDRTSEARTRVIDDESDYFASESNRWLSPQQRALISKKEKELRDRRHGKNRTFTLDFAGRKIVEDVDDYSSLDQEAIVKSLLKEASVQSSVDSKLASEEYSLPTPQYIERTDDKRSKDVAWASVKPVGADVSLSRVQDTELQLMNDLGLCLSMHQPYASLLVKGIKTEEGRTWYSSHRGRLWIASASRVPTSEDIEDVESMYKKAGQDPATFPKHYPAGCLLGCVTVSDVLPQEEYRERYPKGLSQSPYVLVCSEPRELGVYIPVKGQHKIYKLDPHLLAAARKSLKKKT